MALYGLMAWGRSWYPRLGLDLRGGTTITLTARTDNGSSVTSDSLELARQILQQRIDSLGVGESAVTTQGGNHIVVAVPNVQKDELLRMVGQTAQLAFRNVYALDYIAQPASPSPSASGSATPGATATPSATVSAGPGLPSAPPSSAPASASASASPSSSPSSGAASATTAERLKWQPTAADTQAFQNYTNCEKPVTDAPNQPLVACDREGKVKLLMGPTIISGTEVTEAGVTIPQNALQPVVVLRFNSQGTNDFTAATTYLAQQNDPMNSFAIVLDGKVISYPRVSAPITGGSAQIEGNFDTQTANELATVLKYGALPLTFDLSSVENISATLGGEQLRAGIIAGIIGLALVVLYSFLYYRGLGILVVGSLMMAFVLTYASMVLLGQSVGFALNLPGIAGAIVAIGVTADSFIIYFERIRDEIRDGRSLRTAIETGWEKARGTIVVADFVSLLSAIILFILAIGSVRGFAFTLGLTTIIDLVIVFFFTKPMMSILGHTKFFGEGHAGSGLSADHMGVSRDSLMGRVARSARTKGA